MSLPHADQALQLSVSAQTCSPSGKRERKREGKRKQRRRERVRDSDNERCSDGRPLRKYFAERWVRLRCERWPPPVRAINGLIHNSAVSAEGELKGEGEGFIKTVTLLLLHPHFQGYLWHVYNVHSLFLTHTHTLNEIYTVALRFSAWGPGPPEGRKRVPGGQQEVGGKSK